MIRLERERTDSAVPAKYRGVKKQEKEAELLKAWRDAGGAPKFDTDYWKGAKPQLKRESHEKCAYCEADVSVVAHGDVEHFRPKSIYWWLAYCYDNYLYACQICNQTHKGNEFPLHGKVMASPAIAANAADAELKAFAGSLAPDPLDGEPRCTLARFAGNALAEKAGLPDPYREDPEPMFAWEVDRDNKEVLIRRRDGRVRATRAVDAVERCLGLNREQLRRARWRVYKNLETLKKALLRFQALGDPLHEEIAAEIKAMMSAEGCFSGMVRYFVLVEWKLEGFASWR